MKKYTLRLSDKFDNKIINVLADEVQINGIAHGGVFVFKTKAKSPTEIMDTVALYPVQETIIEKIEKYNEQ